MGFFRRWQGVLSVLGCLAAPLSAHAQVRLVDTPAPIREFLAPHLPTDPITGSSDALRLQHQLTLSVPELLATEGYFEPQLDFMAGAENLSLRITPGPRVMVSRVNITLEGDISEERRAQLLANWQLPAGQAFRQEDWNLAKQHLLTSLLARDFRAARLEDSRAEVDIEQHSAELTLTYVTGPRYRFGPMQIDGLSRYSTELIGRYNKAYVEGAPYQASVLTDLQTSLQGSAYFSSVQVDSEPESATGPDAAGEMTLPVRLRVVERAPHSISFGVGASSNNGVKLEANLNTYDLFNKAWKLNTGFRHEDNRQIAYADVYLPPAEARYQPSLGAVVESTDIEGLQTDRYAFRIQRTHQRGSIEATFSLNWQEEDKTPDGALTTSTHALVPDALWIWRHVDSLLAPTKGQVVHFQVGVGSQALASEQDFLRLYSRWQQYFNFGPRNIISLRAEYGQTYADSRHEIPEEYLFRAGGTNSVRGYDYQSLGVKEGDATVGGRYLLTASAEFTHWLDESWGIAAFIDAGDATDNSSNIDPAIGSGLGVRWRSPAGPIAFDLAYGKRDERFRLHFFLAIPF